MDYRRQWILAAGVHSIDTSAILERDDLGWMVGCILMAAGVMCYYIASRRWRHLAGTAAVRHELRRPKFAKPARRAQSALRSKTMSRTSKRGLCISLRHLFVGVTLLALLIGLTMNAPGVVFVSLIVVLPLLFVTLMASLSGGKRSEPSDDLTNPADTRSSS